jgi:sugar-phosphatase
VRSGEYERGKPAPDCFLLAARKLGAEPAECTVFEDSEAGVAAGKAAGMRVVALRLPDHPSQDLSAADLVLEDLSRFEGP